MMLNISSLDEDKLIDGCLRNKEKAQKTLYTSYAPKMLGVCLRYIHERNTAEEIMIGGFVKVFEKISQFKREGSFEGWIRRIMVNESLTYIRRNKSMYLEVDIEKAETQPDYNQLNDHLEEQDLLKMIQELPVGYRTVFNMYVIEGYSHKEIAEMLEITESTSKTQLSRARSVLQKKLRQMDDQITKMKGYE